MITREDLLIRQNYDLDLKDRKTRTQRPDVILRTNMLPKERGINGDFTMEQI